MAIGMALAPSAGAAAATQLGITAVSGAMSAVTGIMAFQNQKAMYKMQQAQNAQNRLLATRSMLDQARQLSLRQDQERMAAADKLMNSNIEAAKIKGRVVASAGEAGVSGGIIGTLLRDVERTRLRNADAVNRNFDATSQQLAMEREGLYTQAQSRINNMPIPEKPSALATGLQIGGGLLDSYNTFYARNKDSVFKNNTNLKTT